MGLMFRVGGNSCVFRSQRGMSNTVPAWVLPTINSPVAAHVVLSVSSFRSELQPVCSLDWPGGGVPKPKKRAKHRLPRALENRTIFGLERLRITTGCTRKPWRARRVVLGRRAVLSPKHCVLFSRADLRLFLLAGQYLLHEAPHASIRFLKGALRSALWTGIREFRGFGH